MFYILYKTTNLTDGKFYIGIHQTDDIDDTYLGSGKYLLSAIKKHGRDNFTREILEVFSTECEMVAREIEVVTEEFCNRDDTYNIMPGGKWGSSKRNGLSFKGRQHTIETKAKQSDYATGNIPGSGTRQKMSDNNFAKQSPDEQKRHASHAGKIGGSKPKTEEHKEKIRLSLLARNEEKRKLSVGDKSTGSDTAL